MQCLLQATGLLVEHESKGWAATAESAARAVQEARASAETWCAPRLLELLALIHSNDGRRAAALEAGRAAEAAFEAAGETLMLAVVRNHLAWALREREDDTAAVRRSIELGEQALAGIDPQRQRHPMTCRRLTAPRRQLAGHTRLELACPVARHRQLGVRRVFQAKTK